MTTVAVCQIAPVVANGAENRLRISAAVKKAAEQQAQVVVLPELANSGYMFNNTKELRQAAEPAEGDTTHALVELASDHRLVIICGLAEIDDNTVYNSAVLVDETGLRARYRKTHLWNTEKTIGFTPGAAPPPVIDTPYGRISMMICYDLEFPELVRTSALAGTELLCAPSNWPIWPHPATERPGEIVRVQANASINRIFIAVADRTGTERGQEWLGGSVVVDEDGYPATKPAFGSETILTATIDMARAHNKSISENNDVHEDLRPELYGY